MKLKGIDGDPHKRWRHVVLIRSNAKNLPDLDIPMPARNALFLQNIVTGGAWLSSISCRECWVKSRNERNPIFHGHILDGHSGETARDNLEEGGDDVKSSCPYDQGLHVLQWRKQRRRTRGWANPKNNVSVRIVVCSSTT